MKDERKRVHMIGISPIVAEKIDDFFIEKGLEGLSWSKKLDKLVKIARGGHE